MPIRSICAPFRGIGDLYAQPDESRFFHRDSPDVDFVVSKNDWHKLEQFFQQMGYAPNKRFNLLNGSQRQIYYNEIGRQSN